MFRRKEEDMQEELDVIDTGSDAKTASAAAPASGASYAAGAAPAANRSPAPTAGAPAYRMGAQPASGAANVGGARPATPQPGQAANASTARPLSSPNSDVRQSPAGGMTKNSKRILTVGAEINLKGEIATCDRLVIEGMVDASLKDVHTVEISEAGSFKGTAAVEDAEISGLFEGDLMVRNRLTIYSTGKVRGKISYGEIEIERGGELTGEIRLGGAEAKSEKKAAA
jgi:cytoskeletal protein CcmA (bactofilin family)